jgi:hypothetical protein
MKTRNGFVSNSSSSSFIIVYKKRVEDEDLYNESFSAMIRRHEVDIFTDKKEDVLEVVAEKIKDEKYYFGSARFWRGVKDKINKVPDSYDVMYLEIERGNSMIEVVMRLYVEKGYLDILEKWEG